jgi:hypothetical protein
MVVLSEPLLTGHNEKMGRTLVFSTRRADTIEGNTAESPGATWFVAVVHAILTCNLVDQEIGAGGATSNA